MILFGLIGESLSHSFSGKYFEDKFSSEGLLSLYRYELFELSSITEFPALINSHRQLRGLNVTIPFKESILPYLSRLEGEAIPIKAVNTICIDRNEAGEVKTTVGFNTDALGFYHSLSPLLNRNDAGAMILGTGGASKAVEYVIRELLQLKVIKISRTPGIDHITYRQITPELIAQYPIIINTTPLGTSPYTDLCPPIPYDFLSPKNLLFDLVYNPAETRFLKLGKQRGARIKNGEEMLKLQAEKSWGIWKERL